MEHRIEVLAEWSGVEQLMTFTNSLEDVLSLSAEQSYFLRLVVEEIGTNIVKYGYQEGHVGVIELRCRAVAGALHVVIRDHGQPFDPRECPDPELSDDAATRAIGGLGVFLVRELADDLAYHHDVQSGWNELVVTKNQ